MATPELVFSNESFRETVFARPDSLFDLYTDLVPGGGQYRADLYVKKRSVSGTTWSSSTFLEQSIDVTFPVSPALTSDNTIHIVYGDGQVAYKNYDGEKWSTTHYISSGQVLKSANLSSVSNDLFSVWKEQFSNYIKYRQYDAVPLAPQNLKLTIYQQGTNKYPKLDWTLNTEPDVRRTDNTNAYKIERRTRTAGIGLWSAWSVIAQKNQDVSTYTDMSINNAGGGDKEAEYRLKIKDIEDNWSDYSSTVSTAYGMGHGEKRGVDNTANNLIEFRLDQNYPNPFNPSTQIKYTLAKDADVAVKVYDMLGTEVAKLVNETQTVGNHTINFNAKNLSSGVYIYRITAINNGRILFADSKQMLLIK